MKIRSLKFRTPQGFDTALDASYSDNNDAGNAADSTDSVAGDFLDNSFKSGNLPETHITDSFYENLWDSDARQDLQNRPVDQGEASSYGDDNINPGLVIEQSVSSVLSFADFVQQQILTKCLKAL